MSPTPEQAERITRHVTCLGCGCVCDDIDVVTRGPRVVEARGACELGAAWFGDGVVPAGASVAGRAAPAPEALDAAADVLRRATRPLVYLAPDLSCEAQREGVALADLLRAAIDSPTSATRGAVLAAQERGRASATLGEVRNRADVVVCWGVDPAVACPRFWSRYAPEPRGVHVPEGRASRTVVAVTVGSAEGPADADRRFELPEDDEVATLTALRALVSAPAGETGADMGDPAVAATWARARVLAPVLTSGAYVAFVADGQRAPGGGSPHEPSGFAALIALAQALNAPTRCALLWLRPGGNVSGADAVLTSQTGYPIAVDFSRGVPRYRPHDGTAAGLLARGETDAVVVIGSAAGIPADLAAVMAREPGVVIGPRATTSAFAGHYVALDSGVAGIHDGGTALRLDDVPLPLRPVVTGPAGAAALVSALRARIVSATGRA